MYSPLRYDVKPLPWVGSVCIPWKSLYRVWLKSYIWLIYTVQKIQFIYFQERNCATSVPISIFMCLWAIYILSWSVYIFGCRKIDRPILKIYNLLQIFECRNWETEHYNSVLDKLAAQFHFWEFINGNQTMLLHNIKQHNVNITWRNVTKRSCSQHKSSKT